MASFVPGSLRVLDFVAQYKIKVAEVRNWTKVCQFDLIYPTVTHHFLMAKFCRHVDLVTTSLSACSSNEELIMRKLRNGISD